MRLRRGPGRDPGSSSGRCSAGSGIAIIMGTNVARPGTNTGEYRPVTGEVRTPAGTSAGTMTGTKAGAMTTSIAAGPVRTDPAKVKEDADADNRIEVRSDTGRA